MKPIIPHKYNVAFRIHNGNDNILEVLEPWCDIIYSDMDYTNYIIKEQPNTDFNLSDKLTHLQSELYDDFEGVVVVIDGNRFTQQDYELIQHLPEILADSGEVGEFELGNLKINISSLETFEDDLIFIINSHNEKN